MLKIHGKFMDSFWEIHGNFTGPVSVLYEFKLTKGFPILICSTFWSARFLNSDIIRSHASTWLARLVADSRRSITRSERQIFIRIVLKIFENETELAAIHGNHAFMEGCDFQRRHLISRKCHGRDSRGRGLDWLCCMTLRTKSKPKY